jgi:hypothetical protein
MYDEATHFHRHFGRYAACIRPLRMQAEVLQLKALPESVVAQRVEEICRREGFAVGLPTAL